jgi:hypothetical protein
MTALLGVIICVTLLFIEPPKSKLQTEGNTPLLPKYSDSNKEEKISNQNVIILEGETRQIKQIRTNKQKNKILDQAIIVDTCIQIYRKK